VIFKPRDYQGAIIRHIIKNKRCAVWASMGSGKSASTLEALDELNLVENVFPALIIAPLRVEDSLSCLRQADDTLLCGGESDR